MTAPILGIDIGQAGAAAFLTPDRRLLDVVDLPTLPDGPSCRPTISAPLFADLVRRWQPAAAYIEFVGPRPNDGNKAAFAFGGAKATIEATLTALGVPVFWITVPVWKRLHGIPPGAGMKDVAVPPPCAAGPTRPPSSPGRVTTAAPKPLSSASPG